MKLQIRFFANLYNFLIEDYPLQPNKENIIKLSKSLFKNTAEVNFLLQNIHILDLSYCKTNSVNAIKIILKLYLHSLNKLKISIPKFEYHVKYNVFLKQNVVEKILQPPIKELNTSHVLFKKYNLQELKTLLYKNFNRPIFNSSFSKFVPILNFINQFFCISSTKINYCEFNFIKELSERGFDKEYLEIFFNKEINIELNYTTEISIQDKNLDNFINLPQVAYNRFLVLYHEVFNICDNNDRLIKSLISVASLNNLENIIEIVISVSEAVNLDNKSSKIFIHFIVSYREEFLSLYYDLFEKLSIEHSDLLINACSNNDELLKLFIAPLDSLNLDERYDIIEAVIKTCENKPELIPLLSTQLLNILAYFNTTYNFERGILDKVMKK